MYVVRECHIVWDYVWDGRIILGMDGNGQRREKGERENRRRRWNILHGLFGTEEYRNNVGEKRKRNR